MGRRKNSDNPVALLQLAVGGSVWLIRTSEISLPAELREILLDGSVTKLVVSFDSADRKKLSSSFGLKDCQGILDIQELAKRQGLPVLGFGLKKLAKHCGWRIEKDHSVSVSNWASKQLTERQLQYARDDAFFTLLVALSLLHEGPPVLEELQSQREESSVS